MFTFEENFDSRAKLKVVGVGGGGGNADVYKRQG